MGDWEKSLPIPPLAQSSRRLLSRATQRTLSLVHQSLQCPPGSSASTGSQGFHYRNPLRYRPRALENGVMIQRQGKE